MGYTTEFNGTFSISPAMKPEHIAYINKFSETRRMKRNSELTSKRPDPIREATGLPVGLEGGYFVGESGDFGQGEGGLFNLPEDVVDNNKAPNGQPGLWCDWVCVFKDLYGHENPVSTEPVEMELEWGQGEKFYNYVKWLKYLIEHFFGPWGYVLDGSIEWRGQDWDDTGFIEVTKNEVIVEGRN